MRTFFRILVLAGALVAALVAVEAASAQDEQHPTIAASAADDVVWGGGFEPGAPVTVEIRGTPGGAVLETVDAAADGDGWLELGDGALATDLVPGLEVVATSGPFFQALTLVELTVDVVDPGRGSVRGTAGDGATVVVESNGAQLSVTAAGGAWVADFAGAGLAVGREASAQVLDADGDATWAGRGAPTLSAFFHYDELGLETRINGGGFASGAVVGVEILSAPGGTVLWSGAFVAEDGSFDSCCMYDVLAPLGVRLEPGMQLRATDTVTGVVKELTLARFTFDELDPTLDVASGTAPPGSTVSVSVSGPPHEDGYWAETLADPVTGAWRLELDPAAHDVGWRAWGEASSADEDGDQTGAMIQPRTIGVDAAAGTVGGTWFSVGADVAVEVLDAGGGVLWSGTVSTGTARSFSLAPGIALEPGMTVRAVDGPAVKELVLVPLSFDVLDPVTDAAAGTGPPDGSVRLWVWWEGIGGGEREDVPVDAAGRWAYAFVDEDITAESSAGVYVADAEGDRTEAKLAAPTAAIPELRDDVAALVAAGELPRTAGRVLTATLDSALASLTGSTSSPRTLASTSSDRSERSERLGVKHAIVKLHAFELEVKALVRSHRLAPAPGADLVERARTIRVGLGG